MWAYLISSCAKETEAIGFIMSPQNLNTDCTEINPSLFQSAVMLCVCVDKGGIGGSYHKWGSVSFRVWATNSRTLMEVTAAKIIFWGLAALQLFFSKIR